jgi:hypothetical protein
MSDLLERMWTDVQKEQRKNRKATQLITNRSEVSGEAFSAPVSSLADAPTAADGMDTEAFRFIDGILHYYNPPADSWWSVANSVIAAQYATATIPEFDLISIPQTFNFWHIHAQLRSNHSATADESLTQINGNTTAGNYATQRIGASGTVTVNIRRNTTDATIWDGFVTAANSLAGAYSTVDMYISNIRDPGKAKWARTEWSWAGSTVATIAWQRTTGIFAPTAVVNRLRFFLSNGDFVSGSYVLIVGSHIPFE